MKAPKMPSVEYEAETKTKSNCNAGSVEGRADFESVLTHRYRQQQVEFFESKLADSTVYANNVPSDDPIHSQVSISTALTTISTTQYLQLHVLQLLQLFFWNQLPVLEGSNNDSSCSSSNKKTLATLISTGTYTSCFKHRRCLLALR